MTALKNLKRFESNADREIATMAISQLPARALLAGLHYFTYQARHAQVLGRPSMAGVAETISNRVGYLLPVIASSQAEPFGASARDAVEVFVEADPEGEQLANLLAYSHFSEFMPEVHKGYYEIREERSSFRLEHRSPSFAEMQAHDILLSELALVFPLPTKRRIEPDLFALAETAPKFDARIFVPLLLAKAARYRSGIAEANLITGASMQSIFGFGYETFYQIRAAVMGYAEFADDMSAVLGALACAKNNGAGVSDETLEWVSVNHQAVSFIRLIAALSGCPINAVERFLALFTLDFRDTPPTHHAGDGFFPPFARFSESFIFSPELVLSYTHLRNAVFGFAVEQRKADRTGGQNLFSKKVSGDLEPVLVSQAIELLRRSHKWVICTEVDYGIGKVDLLVAGPTGQVLLLQAKGTLPPQGARLTERLGDRIREGIRQVQRFRQIPPTEQEQIISRAVGRRTIHSDIRHGLLARACFGAHEAYVPEADLTLVTLPTLSLALGEMRQTREEPDARKLIARLNGVQTKLFQDVAYRWEQGQMTLAGRNITMPLLKFDEDRVDAARRLAWNQSILPDTGT